MTARSQSLYGEVGGDKSKLPQRFRRTWQQQKEGPIQKLSQISSGIPVQTYTLTIKRFSFVLIRDVSHFLTSTKLHANAGKY